MFVTPLLASFALKTSDGFSFGGLRSIGAEMLDELAAALT